MNMYIQKIVFKLALFIYRKFANDYNYYLLTLKRFDNTKPNLKKPKTFNEKILYIALNDRRYIYTECVDKLLVKNIVANKIGIKYVTPTLDTWSNAKDIKLDSLGNKFILKTNHNSGDCIFIRNWSQEKKEINIKKIQKHFKKSLNFNRYYSSREWAYKDVKPKVFAEKLLESSYDKDLIDYKFFCFNGVPKFIQVDSQRFINHRRNFFSMNWDELPYKKSNVMRNEKKIRKPKKLNEMIWIASELSYSFPFSRIDLYNLKNSEEENIRFGEITFYPGGAITRFEPDFLNKDFGELINIGHFEC